VEVVVIDDELSAEERAELHSSLDRAPAAVLSASLPPTTERRRRTKRGTLRAMHAPKIRVENGRIQIDEPTDLPNGTELYLVPAEQLDDVVLLRDDGLDDAERKRLHASIRRGIEDCRAGRVTDFDEFLAELDAQP
jgi:hypothetical protein